MKQKKDIDAKVQDSLDSLDGMQRAEASPWLFTRVQARMQRVENSAWATINSFLAKPVIAFAGLCLILTMNAFFLISAQKKSTQQVISAQSETVPESESIVASNSSFEYENLVQP